MKYIGSKSRHAKEIISAIEPYRKDGQVWVEPFVGGANMIDKVKGERIGADLNPYIISLFQGLQNGFVPPDFVSECEYKTVSNSRVVTPLTGFIGFGCSYSGKFFGGYARGKSSNGKNRNYCAESKRNILKQAPNLVGVRFVNCSYEDLEIPKGSLIYCDPPYNNTTRYSTGGFDSKQFWEWCNKKVEEGHTVFVSEYEAPSNWKSIWSKEVNNTLVKDTGSKRGVEHLFYIKDVSNS